MYHKIKPKVITLGKGLVVEDERELIKCWRYSLCIRTMYRTIKAQIKSVLIQKKKREDVPTEGKTYYDIRNVDVVEPQR